MGDTRAATQHVVEHGDASNLPDTSWAFRRALIFLVTIVCLAFCGWIVGKIEDVTTLRMIARYSLALVGLCLFLYVAGATATDVIRLVSAFRTTRRETTTIAPPPATISPDGGVQTDEPRP